MSSARILPASLIPCRKHRPRGRQDQAVFPRGRIDKCLPLKPRRKQAWSRVPSKAAGRLFSEGHWDHVRVHRRQPSDRDAGRTCYGCWELHVAQVAFRAQVSCSCNRVALACPTVHRMRPLRSVGRSANGLRIRTQPGRERRRDASISSPKNSARCLAARGASP